MNEAERIAHLEAEYAALRAEVKVLRKQLAAGSGMAARTERLPEER